MRNKKEFQYACVRGGKGKGKGKKEQMENGMFGSALSRMVVEERGHVGIS